MYDLTTRYGFFYQTFPRYAGQNTLKLKDPELDYLATKPKKGLSYIDIAEINDAYQCTGLIYNYDNGKTLRLLIVIYCKVISNKKKYQLLM